VLYFLCRTMPFYFSVSFSSWRKVPDSLDLLYVHP
jgi:hypothetical protein